MVPAVFYRALWIMASTIPSAQRKGNLLYSDVPHFRYNLCYKIRQDHNPERYTRHSHPKSGLKNCTVTCFITGRISCPCCRNRMRTHIPTASPKHWQFPTFVANFFHPCVNIFCIQIRQKIMSFSPAHAIVKYNIFRYCFREICFYH